MCCSILAQCTLSSFSNSYLLLYSKRSAFLHFVAASLHTVVFLLFLPPAEAREEHFCNVLRHPYTLSSFSYSYLLLEQEKRTFAMCCGILAHFRLSIQHQLTQGQQIIYQIKIALSNIPKKIKN
jgi:fluoride ion exporter CrcB/FEX